MSDPYLVLGVERDADDEAVHAAYLAAVRDCPPERDPERFEAVRRAYERIRTRRDRLAFELFATGLPTTWDLLQRIGSEDTSRRPDPEHFRALLRDDD